MIGFHLRCDPLTFCDPFREVTCAGEDEASSERRMRGQMLAGRGLRQPSQRQGGKDREKRREGKWWPKVGGDRRDEGVAGEKGLKGTWAWCC